MFIYLSKKIAIPNNNKVRSLCWSYEHGFIACGGDNGLLKVLKLDAVEGEDGGGRVKSLTAPKNLSMNQTLDGHAGSVQAVTWNETYQKLTSSDQNGLIIVWMMYKGQWYEEMINNRNKSVVRGMSWTSDGMRICIVYEDGAVIVGSVDGNRLWGKELKGMRLSQCDWSPDGKLLLLGVLDTEVHVYDNNGNFISKVPMAAQQGAFGRPPAYSPPIIGIRWYSGVNATSSLSELPTLAIAFENGRVQLMRHECDENALIVDVELSVACVDWNYNGTMLAVAGRQESEADNRRNFVKFYTPTGDLLQVLKVPGKDIYSCSWEKEGLRIAMAVDSYIFFANIRPDYKWCYFASTIAYCLQGNLQTLNDGGSGEQSSTNSTSTVIFWHVPSEHKHVKSVKNFLQIAAQGQYCVMASKVDSDSNSALASGGSKKARATSSLVLCNAIGSPIDTVTVELAVRFLTVVSSRAIAASGDSFAVWRFKTPQAPLKTNGAGGAYDLSRVYDSIADDSDTNLTAIFVSRSDPITCITATDKMLMVAQASGTFQQYLLPNVKVIHRFQINYLPAKMALSCDSSKLAIVDNNGLLVVYDFEETDNDANGKLLDFERKDTWDVRWAADNAAMFAVTEKSKLVTFKAMEAEEAIVSTGYLCSFENLRVMTVLLDELISGAESGTDQSLKIADYVVEFETRALRESRELLTKSGIGEASQFIERVSHPRLWQLLAESALHSLDLVAAEQAFLRCKDEKGAQFSRRIGQLQNDSFKRAEICAYFGQFEEAERIYLDIDRRDLAIALRKTLGDWIRVVELLKSDLGASNDAELRQALQSVGDYYADMQQWDEAVVYYEQSAAYEQLFECYAILENYDSLRLLLNNFNDNNPILLEFGRTFESVGMCKEAVKAYLKARKVDLAINCCVTMSEWKTAIDLAHQYDVPNIDSLLSKYGEHLLAKGKQFDVVELYRKANRVNDAAAAMLKVIEEARDEKRADPLLLKKLYVLIGILYEQQRSLASSRSSSASSARGGRKTNTLNALLTDDAFAGVATNYKALDQPWKGAEAYHFLLLTQRQLYDGYVDAAMKTALHLRDYDDFVGAEEIYCLIALASCANRSFSICSKAYIKLESADVVADESRRATYEELAISIFAKNPPKDSRNAAKAECTYCETMIADWCTACPSCNTKFPICIASGRPIMDSALQWTCSRCGHHAHKADLVSFVNCPLCHKSLNA